MNRAWTVRLPIAPKAGKWYRIGIAAIGNEISFYIDGDLVHQAIDDLHPAGRIALFAFNALVEFDNVVITGDEISNTGSSGYAVKPKAKSAITWGRIKR